MITFDNFGQNNGSGTDGGSDSFNFTNSGNFIIASVSIDSVDTGIGSLIYGGDSFTELYNTLLGVSTRLWVGYLKSPKMGTNNMVLNRSGGSGLTFRTGVISFTGVDLTNPLGGNNSATDSTTSTPISTTVTVTGASGVVVDVLFGSRVATGNAMSPQTEEMNNTGNWSGGVNHLAGMSYVAHSGMDVTMTWENLTFDAGTPRKLLYATELIATSTPPAPSFTPQLIDM